MGIIPGGIGEWKELEVLDLGYNGFSGPLPADLGSNFSLAILLLDNNRLLGILSPEIYNLEMLSEFQVDENRLSGAGRESSCNERSISWNLAHTEHSIHGRVLRATTFPPPETKNFPSFDPFMHNKAPRPAGPEPSASDSVPDGPAYSPNTDVAPAPSPNSNSTSPPTAPASSPSLSAPVPTSVASSKSESFTSKHKVALLTGGPVLAVSLAISVIVMYLHKSNKVATVKPWATGLSGQLQKAFVTVKSTALRRHPPRHYTVKHPSLALLPKKSTFSSLSSTMWAPWLKSPSRVHTARAPRSQRSFSCSSFKDIQNLCEPEPESEALSPRSASILHRVKISTSVLRLWAHRNATPHSPKLPDGDQRVVIYYTSLRVVRRTFEDCKTVRSILRGFRAPIDERDLSMDAKFLDELQEITGNKTLTLPMVFIGGLFIGGAEEVKQLHENGELKRLIQGLPVVDPRACDFCGGLRFVLCKKCNGSHKVYSDKGGFRPCTVCNVNGLIMCPSCSPLRRRHKEV
ncbi:uncharacterized protein Pyn_10728 [Prunus yedoensis var. nudiflora]|uniref:Glutaredoxin domain-containing protein n=1 Tax=Prunus yedoensis var. nudiflora TaxID=2094558 RepID=A0A314XUE9_PRUYE|nr:uncharacterized protein Pyn_10728 [Prunus yedoensis var. nudiflora]